MNKLTLAVLYSDGTISSEYDSSKKVVAVVSNGTYVGLKNTIKTGWKTVRSICERIGTKVYYGYLPLISTLEQWHRDIDNINTTLRELKELGVNAEEFCKADTYWSCSESSVGEAKAISFPLGNVSTVVHTMPCYGRAAIELC